jgi:predicted transcriptional regulator
MNRGVLASLRDLVPIRPLTDGEALRIAELQATRLLQMAGIDEPPVLERVIAELPKIEIRRLIPWPVSGCTDWAKAAWIIAINGAESPQRQRFTIAHEFKHILDHRVVDIIYPPRLGRSSIERAEAISDYFAGCLLMPKVMVRRAWVAGIQDVTRLARLFNVSPAAMRTRLIQLGLIDQIARCESRALAA